jgi:hypothetical protein
MVGNLFAWIVSTKQQQTKKITFFALQVLLQHLWREKRPNVEFMCQQLESSNQDVQSGHEACLAKGNCWSLGTADSRCHL